VDKSVTYLEKSDRELVKAELWDDITDEHLTAWREKWLPHIEECKNRFRNSKVPENKWPQDLHWDWNDKVEIRKGLLAFQRFAITCEGELQSLMLLNTTKTARIDSQKGKHVAYIEYVATAPWNRPDLVKAPSFRKAGTVMVRTAIQLSQNEGFRGRIGLHSLRQSEAFYRRCGMTELGPDSDYDQLTYFEMTEAQALAFLT
jgi:hypothetical protein